ncbi:MAG: hypothetical protein SP1CHLAM54_08160 [Chlamydiia bacterium]|nr:hypothetical protein [Chlamydiia bacterium]MCH9615722.1 hypothetical protein [Chlamydiia bacterium]MCH9628875.1 hypothetical protein [Chlamydiia bacterium]
MGKQILILTNDQATLSAFSFVINEIPCEFFTTSSAKAAMRFFEEKTIDLVFLDLSIIGLKGIDLLKDIRTRSPIIPICILVPSTNGYETALDELEDPVLEHTQVLNKPLGIMQIKQVVSESLE